MAYMHKELKAQLVAEVKKVLPKNWKVTFAVRNYSTIVCTIRKSPVDFSSVIPSYGYTQLNPYSIEKLPLDEETVNTLLKIKEALYSENYDNSDVMTDYFDVGYCVDICIGDYKKPYEQI